MDVYEPSQTSLDFSPKAKRVKKTEQKQKQKQLACNELNRSESGKMKSAVRKSSSDSCVSTAVRAEELRLNLSPEFPSFVKIMLPSHVAGCFWLGLPKRFCDLHMPKHDALIVLEDDNGNVCETKYLDKKVALSAGGKGFSIDHKLVEGDVLVFHLITPFKFRVYIIRSNGADEEDYALGQNKQEDTVEIVASDEEAETWKAFLERKLDGDNMNQKQSNETSESDQCDKHGDDISPKVSDGIRLSGVVFAFEEVGGIEDFKIVVNGLVIDSEISKYVQSKYYELCCSQKAFLHKNLLEGLNCRLIAGIISETTNIAEAIRASKIASSVGSFVIWDKALRAFEGLGMNVGFLLSWLDQLINLATKSERCENARAERDSARDELRILKAKILAAKEKVKRFDAKFETLRANHHELLAKFQEAASAPW